MAQLNPALQAMLAQAEASGQPELWELDPPAARMMFKEMAKMLGSPPVPVHAVQDISIQGPGGPLPLRIYTPHPLAPGKTLPIFVLLHGGGWVIGDPSTHDDLAHFLCKEAECVVVSVDYRLAPEHKFPAAVEDAWAAVRWVAERAGALGGDSGRIAVGGDSAGGNLTAVVAQLAQAHGGPSLAAQVLWYPVTDIDADTPSRRDFAEGYFLTRKAMDWFLAHYLSREADGLDHRVSPGLSQDLSGLPPALVITAGFDPLRDEGQAYARRLEAAGVPVEHTCYEDMIHGFLSMSAVTATAQTGLAQSAAFLRRVFTG